MSVENKDANDKTAAERQNERARAYRIRKRLKENENDVSAEDKAWFDNYEKTKQARGNQWMAAPERDEEPENDTPPDAPEANDAGVDYAAPPRPPRIDVGERNNEEKKGSGKTGQQSDDWRDKYRRSGADGREETCAFIASQITGVLHGMEAELALAGKKPLVDTQVLYSAWVLTLDKWLPKNVKVEPMHVAVLGSSAMVVQRFMNRTEIAEARKVKDAEDTVRGWNPSVNPPEPPPPAKEPESPPASEPIKEAVAEQTTPPTPMPPIINIGASAVVDDKLPPGAVY